MQTASDIFWNLFVATGSVMFYLLYKRMLMQ